MTSDLSDPNKVPEKASIDLTEHVPEPTVGQQEAVGADASLSVDFRSAKESAFAEQEPTLIREPELRGYPPIHPSVFLMLGTLLSATILGLFLSGEFGSFLVASWDVGLVSCVCVLAYLGLHRPLAFAFSLVLTCLLLFGVALFNVLVSFMALDASTVSDAEFNLPAGALIVLGWVFLASLISASSAGLAWLPAFRNLGTLLGCHGDWNRVQILALALVSSLTLLGFIPLAILGEAPMLTMIEKNAAIEEDSGDERGTAGMFRDDMYSLCWMMLAAALAVGYGVQRNVSETLNRLGLSRISMKQVGCALLLIVVLVIFGEISDVGIAWTWKLCGWPQTNEETVSSMFASYITPLGAIVIAISAGLGEEVAIRGILQPRLGILLSNLLFTSLHAYQYNWDALLSVFITGLVLGVIRSKSSTTMSVVVHGGFDFVLVMMEFYSIEIFPG